MYYIEEEIKCIEDKKVVLLQSGGLESIYLAKLLSDYCFEINHLFIDYGQNSCKSELKAANNIVKAYGGTLHQVKISMPWLKKDTVLCGEEVKSYDVSNQMGCVECGTYVPLRNHVLISIAGSLAESLDVCYIATGLDNSQDIFGVPLGGTPDKHPNFAYSIENSINEGSVIYQVKGKHISLIAPILGRTKEETIKRGLELGCDFSLSWSCYNNGEKPCGYCCACIDRKSRFKNAGIDEPAFRVI